MTIHEEMRSWRAHLKESRKEVVPIDVVNLVYSQMETPEVPLTDDERKAYLKFVYQSIVEVSSLYFEGIGE